MNKMISLVIWLFLNSQFLNCYHRQEISSTNRFSYQENEQVFASILSEITRIFNDQNPNVDEIHLMDIYSKTRGSDYYIVLAHGIRGDRQFCGSLEDELFGLFVVDNSFMKVIVVLDIIPTLRWNDYTMSLEKPMNDSIVLIGEGLSYADENFRRSYLWPQLEK